MVLIAVVTCESRKAQAEAQRKTWVPLVQNAVVKFFLAKQNRDPLPDEVFLDVPDDYKSLPLKVQAMIQWAVAHGFQSVFKCDDDCFVFPNRLLDLKPKAEYGGNVMEPGAWCSGFGYWLGRDALEYLAAAPRPFLALREDRWVGGVLASKGIRPVQVLGIEPSNKPNPCEMLNGQSVCVAEFTPEQMWRAHRGRQGWKSRLVGSGLTSQRVAQVLD